jgi:hypothetical protein
MAVLKVSNIKDLTGSSGFTFSNGTISVAGTLTVTDIVIEGTIGGSSNSIIPSVSGQSGKFLTTNGTSLSWGSVSTGNITSMNVYTGNGTWSRPTGVRYIHVRVQGGGGGGSGHSESGGAGGYSERIINVESVSSVSVTVGGAGTGTWYFGFGNDGGTSSFGGYLSAGGGHGANRINAHSGGLGRNGSGGDLNVWGGGGFSHTDHRMGGGGLGGASHFGGSVAAGWPNGGHFSHNHQDHAAYGAGGSGGHFHSFRGSDGKSGVVIVTNYL